MGEGEREGQCLLNGNCVEFETWIVCVAVSRWDVPEVRRADNASLRPMGAELSL